MQERERISITLRKEIIRLIDSRVDGVKLRNRSHAIEHYLKETLATPMDQAVILAGDQSKPLIQIGGKTVLEHMILSLKKTGINKFIICTRNDPKPVRDLLSKKLYSDLEISFVQNSTTGTAQALLACKKKLGSENFILLYGDVIADVDLLDLLDFHTSAKSIATMVVASVPDPMPWGVVRLKRDRIVRFEEKPSDKAKLTNLINSGIYVFEPGIFSYVNSSMISLENEVFPSLAESNKLHGYLLDGVWFDVGVQSLRKLAEEYWGNGLNDRMQSNLQLEESTHLDENEPAYTSLMSS